MVTPERIQAKLQGLMNQCAETTGVVDSDLTSAVNRVIDGYGGGGGYDDGYADGKRDGIAEGEAQGAENEKKRFWGVYQDNGNRTGWSYGFGGWPVDAIDPLYDVRPIGAASMFPNITSSNGKGLNIPEIEARNNIVFDFSKCTNFANFIAWGLVEDLGFVDTTSAAQPIFQYCNALKRLSIALKEDGSQNCSTSFDNDNGLKELTVVSGVFGSSLNFRWSTKLSKASVYSIFNALSDSTSGLSVTFSKEILNQEFWDPDTDIIHPVWSIGEWAALIATKPNWTINLV